MRSIKLSAENTGVSRVPGIRRAISAIMIVAGGVIAVQPSPAAAQWSTTYDQSYLPGSSNWQFRKNYPTADRLFNAFDYGHAILYERLWNAPKAPVTELEEKEFNFITRELLVHPPNLPLEEGAIEIAYARLAPEAKQMFDWAHLLHRQIYDAWSDEQLSVAQKDARVQELLRYYKSRKDLAFSSQPKSMELMEGQPYSLAFRKKYPKFNGLIWAYHWLQIGLYEPLLAGKNKDERQTGVLAAVTRFRQMIENAPSQMPRMMPMTAAVAPLFTARYPEAAIIFDNLHSMHDVVSDILANPSVPRDRKRSEILRAAQRYRDDTSFVMTPVEWREMALGMGIENMGGPVHGFLASFPQPAMERSAMAGESGMAGMSGMTGPGKDAGHPAASKQTAGGMAGMAGMDHAGMDHAAMPGMKMDTTAAMPGMKMDTTAAMPGMKMDTTAAMPGMKMDTAMEGMDMGTMPSGPSGDMITLHKRMMADPVIRARVNADPSMRQMMDRVMADMMAGTNEGTGKRPAAARSRTIGKSSARSSRTSAAALTKTTAKKPAKAPATTPAKTTDKKPAPKPDPMAGMPGMDHGKMDMGPKKK